MLIETKRLIICEFKLDMAYDVHINSLDEDTRRFVSDEVFETEQDAYETIEYLMSVYSTHEGPLVYPILLKEGTNIGYVQLVPLNEEEYEIGYHIAKKHTKKGYATEAVNAFLTHLKSLGLKNIFGITLSNNYASIKVLEKTGFKQVFKGVSTYQGEEKEIVKYIYDF